MGFPSGLPAFWEEPMDEIVLGGQTIPFTLVRKRIKNINLHIQKDGSIFVSAPARVPKAYVLQVLHEKEAFLLRTREALLRRQQQAPPPKAFVEGETFRLLGRFYTLKRVRTPGVAAEGGALLCGPGDPKKLVPTWLRKAGECVFQKAANTARERLLAQQFPLPEGVQLRQRRMVSRWGSCNPARKAVTFSTRLLETPYPCIEAVAMHEFSHFLHADHSKAFYAVLERCMPDYRARAKILCEEAYRIFYNE